MMGLGESLSARGEFFSLMQPLETLSIDTWAQFGFLSNGKTDGAERHGASTM